MNRRIVVVLVMTVLIHAAYADRGGFPFHKNVQLFEPNQRAMIAWNGTEEILILSTDIHASESTQVLEVIPMPNEPVVTKGDVEIFRKATNLINSKLYPPRPMHEMLKKSMAPVRAAPAGEITFHEKIGAHDISVTHVLNEKEFVKWVEDYLRKAGAENPEIPKPMKAIIRQYLSDSFAWFSFDVISVNEIPKTNDAIQYQFKSTFCFYPLRISRLGFGNTNIHLLLLTPKLLKADPDRSYLNFKVDHNPVDISLADLQGLSTDMAKLLGNPATMKLRIWTLFGKLSAFNRDLISSFMN
jgi:hypothetical protein